MKQLSNTDVRGGVGGMRVEGGEKFCHLGVYAISRYSPPGGALTASAVFLLPKFTIQIADTTYLVFFCAPPMLGGVRATIETIIFNMVIFPLKKCLVFIGQVCRKFSTT